MELQVLCGNSREEIQFEKGQCLADILEDNGIELTMSCGGAGICGMCGVRIIEGNLPVTDADKRRFGEKELAEGFRLACRAYPDSDLTIRVEEDPEADILLAEDGETGTADAAGAQSGLSIEALKEMLRRDRGIFGVAIDIGTTTIAFSLVNIKNSTIMYQKGLPNSQRRYGSDVISRVRASMDGQADALRRAIQEDLLHGLDAILLGDRAGGAERIRPDHIVIACNTAMRHLLLGESCEGLAAYPFDAGENGLVLTDGFRLLDDFGYIDIPVTILPGLTPFVGGDIVSGMLASGFCTDQKKKLLLDLGTNGEMALYDGKKLYVTSTAAGPAFEGGSLSCGSEAVGVLADLLNRGLMDETGLLAAPFFEKGYPVIDKLSGKNVLLTQADVRQLQLAIAAMRAGTALLLKAAGLTADDLSTVILAGGMGFHLDARKAMRVGLLPPIDPMKILAGGNTSLKGAIRYLRTCEEEIELPPCEEIVLANEPDFNELYVNYMTFPDAPEEEEENTDF
ncbi:MAG: ASKHA domain-containing protein [Lachnospiraceae bacterium]|nr:ASKHA domain-containing protein [Lachnospiraceae bacterium]